MALEAIKKEAEDGRKEGSLERQIYKSKPEIFAFNFSKQSWLKQSRLFQFCTTQTMLKAKVLYKVGDLISFDS